MNLDEFLANLAGEPDRVVSRGAWTSPADVLAMAAQPAGLPLTDFLAASGRRAERRDVRYRHVLGPPAASAAIEEWHARRKIACRVPADLAALVKRVNGIHLWADAATGRSYVGLAPVEEWELARERMPGADALLDDRYVAVSYHQDGASFVVVNSATGEYFLMDAAGPDTSVRIADSADELLDWLWRTRLAPTST